MYSARRIVAKSGWGRRRHQLQQLPVTGHVWRRRRWPRRHFVRGVAYCCPPGRPTAAAGGRGAGAPVAGGGRGAVVADIARTAWAMKTATAGTIAASSIKHLRLMPLTHTAGRRRLSINPRVERTPRRNFRCGEENLMIDERKQPSCIPNMLLKGPISLVPILHFDPVSL